VGLRKTVSYSIHRQPLNTRVQYSTTLQIVSMRLCEIAMCKMEGRHKIDPRPKTQNPKSENPHNHINNQSTRGGRGHRSPVGSREGRERLLFVLRGQVVHLSIYLHKPTLFVAVALLTTVLCVRELHELIPYRLSGYTPELWRSFCHPAIEIVPF